MTDEWRQISTSMKPILNFAKFSLKNSATNPDLHFVNKIFFWECKSFTNKNFRQHFNFTQTKGGEEKAFFDKL
jgi:hypothetical protein